VKNSAEKEEEWSLMVEVKPENNTLPLQGIRILDLSQNLAGPGPCRWGSGSEITAEPAEAISSSFPYFRGESAYFVDQPQQEKSGH
jgi:hypothetical protein